MKKFMSVLLSLVSIICIAFAFAGCNSDENRRLEGDLLEISSSSLEGGNDPRTDFYCTGKVYKVIEQKDNYLLVELSYGVLNPEEYDRKSQRYIEITASNQKRESISLKKINGNKFYTKNYACYSTKSGMQFNHTEIIKVPVSLLVDEEGWFIITVTAYDSADKEHPDGLDGLDIHYKKLEQKIYFNT